MTLTLAFTLWAIAILALPIYLAGWKVKERAHASK